jgi:hypothetical protein
MPTLDKIIPEEECYGENVVRTNRILAYVLKCWTDAPSTDGKQRNGLRLIYFDKFAEFICRILDVLHANKAIRYPSSFAPHNGIHGPGRAAKINRTQEEMDSCGREPGDFRQHEYAYIAEIIEKLPYMSNDTRALFTLSDNYPAWSPKCRIGSGIGVIEWETWLKEGLSVKNDDGSIFLERYEVDLVSRLANATAKLSDKELRAIGTHYSAPGTVVAIEFNRRKWFPLVRSFCKTLCNGSYGGLPNVGTRLKILADEIHRKSGGNKNAYESAWAKIANDLTDGELAKAFRDTQDESRIIWGDSTVNRYTNYSDHLNLLSDYIAGIPEYVSGTDCPDEKKIKACNIAAPRLNKYFSSDGVSFPFSAVASNRDPTLFVNSIERACKCLEQALPPLSNQRRLWSQIPDGWNEYGA